MHRFIDTVLHHLHKWRLIQSVSAIRFEVMCMVIAVALVTGYWNSPQSYVAPAIDCELPVVSLSFTASDTFIDHEFTLSNKGNSDLAIKAIGTGCDCATINVATFPQTIRSGRQFSFAVRIKLNKGSGKMRRTVTVISNDPVQPLLELAVELSPVSVF